MLKYEEHCELVCQMAFFSVFSFKYSNSIQFSAFDFVTEPSEILIHNITIQLLCPKLNYIITQRSHTHVATAVMYLRFIVSA